jgi:DNA polymerase (family 10)
MTEASTASLVDKRTVLKLLQKMAFAAELLDKQDLKPSAVGSAAWTLRSVEQDLGELVASGALKERRDMVKTAKEGIESLVTTGKWPLLDELASQVPAGLFEVQRIKGLGPKKVRVLWSELGITSLAELEYACTENRLLELKGFGKKTQEKVLVGINEVRSYLGRFRLDQIEDIARALLEVIGPGCERTAIAGDLRRATETVDALDIVVTADRKAIIDALKACQDADLTGSDVEGSPLKLTFQGATTRLHFCPSPEVWGIALFIATGSEPYVAKVMKHAATRGLILDASGLKGADGRLPTPDEDALFAALDLITPPAERREASTPLVERGKATPQLVRREDLKGALHNHTTASDGIHTLEQMRQGALDLGLTYLGITEHSETASYAGGLTGDDLEKQRKAIAKLNNDSDGSRCPVFFGIESDILVDGNLDYSNEVLSSLDVVIASVHARNSQSAEEMTARMVAAARHPATDIVGHPTGRMLLGRPPSDYDIAALLDACAETGTAVEHNAQPARLDLKDDHMAMAKERGLLVSIAADAHSVQALSYLDYGVRVARRAGLTADDVLNTRSADELRTWIAERRRRAAG